MKEGRTLSSKIPSEEDCLQLLHLYHVPQNIIDHSYKVLDVAIKIGEKCNADMSLVTAGALLHDIGRSKTHGLMHASYGADLLRGQGIPDSVVNIVRKHTGAGFTKDEAQEIGLPLADYMPSTLEEKIVCHADNLVSGTTLVKSKDKIDKEISKGHESTADRIQTMHNELSSLCDIDLDLLIDN